MAIDLYSTLKNTSQWAFGSAILNGILSSSIFVAFVIALIMVLLIMLMYPAKSGTSFSVVCKLFVYMFLGSLLVLFLHDGVLTYMIKEEYSNNNTDSLMQDVLDDVPAPRDQFGPPISQRNNLQGNLPMKDNFQGNTTENNNSPRISILQDDTPTQLNTRGVLSGPKPPITGGNPYA